MRIKISMMFLLIASLVLIGCTTDADPNNRGFVNPYIGGIRGLEIEFAQNSPPSEIFDNKESPFNVVIQVRNVGETSLGPNDGYIVLSGISPSEFGVSSSDMRREIPIMRAAERLSDGTIIPGDIDVVEFPEMVYQQDIQGNFNTQIRASVCYNYETRSTTSVCLKAEAIDGLNLNDICQVNSDRQVANSGGPIQLSSVRESSQGRDRIMVSYTLTNKGYPNEYFFKPGTDCDRSSTNRDRNVVYVEVEPIDNNRLNADCTGFIGGGRGNSGYVELFGGSPRTISCTFDLTSVDSDFEARSNVKIQYRYMQFIEKQILVKDVS